MALFKYRAVDAEGKPAEGTMEEASARRVVLALEAQGLSVSTVEEAQPRPTILRRAAHLTWNDLEQFNDQFLTITRGNLPLAPSLATMAQDLRNPRLRAVLEDLRRDLEAGRSLEEAMARHPGSFPSMYTALVRAGERAGNLPGVFAALSGYAKRMVELKNDVQALLTYPAFLLVATVGFVYFIMVRVVPVFAEIFKDFGGELPAPTQFLVHLSDVIVRRSLALGALLVLLALLAFALHRLPVRTESGGRPGTWLLNHLPVFGRVYRQASLARFCRALGILLEARVPIVESLSLAGAATGNAMLAEAVSKGAQRVEAGATLADALQETGYFDNAFCWLLRNAEQRGEAPKALLILEDDYDRAINRMRKSILMLAGPVVAISIGIVVGFIVLSLYLPIFTLGDVISGT
jgi:type IV pilus assembly protein PilC